MKYLPTLALAGTLLVGCEADVDVHDDGKKPDVHVNEQKSPDVHVQSPDVNVKQPDVNVQAPGTVTVTNK